MPMISRFSVLITLLPVAVLNPKVVASPKWRIAHSNPSPCTTTALFSPVRSVQESDAFKEFIRRLRSIPGGWRPAVTQEQIDRFCAKMQADTLEFLNRRALVHFVVLGGIEETRAVFGVTDEMVVMLSGRDSGVFNGSLNVRSWNQFMTTPRVRIAGKIEAIRYACLILSLDQNVFPDDACEGEDSFGVRASGINRIEIKFGRLGHSVVVGTDGVINLIGGNTAN